MSVDPMKSFIQNLLTEKQALTDQKTLLLSQNNSLTNLAADSSRENQLLTKKMAEVDSLFKKIDFLRDEEAWGTGISMPRIIIMASSTGIGATVGGPVGAIKGLAIGILAGALTELVINYDRHFKPEYLVNLVNAEADVKTLCRQLGKEEPKFLEECWWHKDQQLILGLIGRDFGFQRRVLN